MVGMVAIGAVLVRVGHDRLGLLVLVAAVAMLIPWAGAWLIFGAAWTAIGSRVGVA